ncbi:paraquat-inducible protein A [Telmatospirillum sp.]|uniref:paraquat-inducible protein A n=1 Tax=Telmatospirillum sp. TaxID=2079197 RepID=UPI00285192BD|nr:paraquat-inducible protein A [Telmatospirillum sp.]MDR3435533.1 paraquat-inducible protein A [Telmatospirillum sp.]
MTDNLIACAECDALHVWRPIAAGERARCVRCGNVLYRRPRMTSDQMLALVVGALLTFLLANAYPIVDLEVQGIRNSATLLGSIVALWTEERWLIAILVFATTILFPLIDLLSMLALFLTVARPGRPMIGFTTLYRFVWVLRPWGMIEVFMLGTLVALVKLSHLAHVVPGVALWAFGALTVLMAVVVSFDLRWLWVEPGRSA